MTKIVLEKAGKKLKLVKVVVTFRHWQSWWPFNKALWQSQTLLWCQWLLTGRYLGHLHLKVRSASFHSFKVKCAGCGGYLDKIYKILVDILDVKAGFPLTNFFIRSDFFRSKTIKSRIGSYFFYFDKCR